MIQMSHILAGRFVSGGHSFSGRLSGDHRYVEKIAGVSIETFIFTNDDIVCNSVPIDQIEETLVPLTENPNRAEIMLLLTYEQRLDVALRLVSERGYKPVFFHEGLLGAPE